MIPEPDDELVTDVRVARWDKLQPVDGQWPNLVGESATRDEVIEQLRDLADFLESRPEIPAPPGYATVYYNVFAAGTDQEKYAQVDYLSTLLGAPVTDELADGGHYRITVPFGGLTYQFVAIPKEPVEREPVSFTAGQEVRIVSEIARAFRRTGMAQAGVIVAAEPDDHYLVRVPGRRTVPLPGTMLEPAGPVSVDTSSGTATSLAEVETWLVDTVARTRISQQQDQAPDTCDVADIRTLSFELARACGLPSSMLLRQLEPAINARVQFYERAGTVKPPQVAAKDRSPRARGTQPGRASRTVGQMANPQPSPRRRR